MSLNAANVINSPVNVLWRMESKFTVDFEGVSASDFGGTSFTFFSAKDATQYYCWGDENSLDADPVETGTGIEVDYGAGASSTAIATAVAAAIDALGDFGATASGTVVTVTNAAVGTSTDAVDTDSTALVTVCNEGKDFDLGLLVGDIEPNFSPANFEIQAHQKGVTTLGLLHQGLDTLELTTVMQETTKSKLKEMYKVYGGVLTPGGGTEVFGVGTAAIGSNLLKKAARLMLQPVTSVSSELTYDFNMMLALPVPDTLTFSGENPRTLSVTWQGFPDDNINSLVDSILIGDAEQAGL